MSKELAQAASSWRTQVGIALVLLIAAFGAVFALQKDAQADVPGAVIEIGDPAAAVNGGGAFAYTFAFDFTGVVAAVAPSTFTFDHDADLTFVSATAGFDIGAIEDAECAVVDADTVACTDAAGVDNWIDDTLTLNFIVNPAGGTISPPSLAACNLQDAGAGTATCVDATPDLLAAYTATNAVSASASATNANGMNHTFTFSLPAGYTCDSDNNVDGVRTCAAGDVNLGGATLVSGPTVADTVLANASTVSIVVNGAPNAAYTVSLDVSLGENVAGFNSATTTKTYVAAELRHMSDTVNGVIGRQEINSNVRGSRHTICAVQANTGIDLNNDGDFVDTNEVAPVAITIPLNALSQINVSAGGGYTSINDPDPTFTDAQIFVGTGANGGLTGATCFSWVSTEAGDQEISVLYTGNDGNPYTVSWDSDNDNNDADGVPNDGPANKSIIKEWNVLEDSTVTLTGAINASKSFTAPEEFVVNVPGTFNPATSSFLFGSTTITDAFNGSHINRTGGKEPATGKLPLAGVNWTVTKTGCGNLAGTLTGTTSLNTAGQVVSGPNLTFTSGTGALACTASNGAVITITGTEPGPLGSGTGVTVTQVIRINIVEPPLATKHVFLAWAGQRVLLEHDWRIPPGDAIFESTPTAENSPGPLGECVFGGDGNFTVTYIKGSGPGNFVPGLGAVLNGSDQATVVVEQEDSQVGDAPTRPQDACISRVIFESEDQGQVDVESFVTQVDQSPFIDNQTKIAFVIYYMKLNTVETSLVTSVSKPLHNSTGSDYSPGNPWDASTDVTDADWNVSKDLLVRVRVSGWFLNSNPSGRERDASDPTNVLPADRWVMPQDWAALQGGACGFDCRPEYDYMFAPNNTKGIALGNPEGTSDTLVTTVTVATTTTTVVVADASNIAVGASIKIGATTATAVTVTAKSGNTLTVSAAATVAAGAKVYLVSGVPFEGPLSALDIPGRGAGMGSAALSDFAPGNVRDTRLGDQVLDWWDAPMPPANVTVDIRGAGFIKQVLKQDVYYLGTANTAGQTYPNPYYIVDIPESPFLPAVVAGGGFAWDTWGLDGPGGAGDRVYRFWTPARVGVNLNGVAGETLTAAQKTELAAIATAYGDTTIARRLVVFSDNHGEAMVTANGDFNLTYDDCVTNVLAGGKHCSQDDVVGKSTVSAIADYPDFRGKHFPVVSNTANVNWTWGGYKEVTIEDGDAEQFKYVVFHALDRDGFCATPTGVVSLHPVLSGHANDTFNGNPAETVDFLIDSDEGGIFIDGALKGTIEVTKEFATMKTFDTAANTTLKEFDPINGSTSECQAWVKVSNSLLGRTNVLVIAHDDEGDIGFDKIVDFTDSVDYTLNFRWSLITWFGADGISPSDALSGTGANEGGSDIKSEVTAVYGWQQDSQEWLAYFPGGEDVPGANDLTGLNLGDAYWIAIKGPASITWTVVTDVN